MGQLGVPREMANNLTIPVRVTSFNIDMLQEMTDKGQIKTIVKPDDKTVIDLKRFRRGTRLMMGDIIYRAGEIIEVKDNKQQVLCGDIVERNGKEIEKLKPANRKYPLQIGYTINRPIIDGDYVLLNRQPTLHKASMQAMYIKLMPHKTIRMGLAITKSFNADFFSQ